MLAGMLNWALAGTLDQDVGWDTGQGCLAEMLNWALTGMLDWALTGMLNWELTEMLNWTLAGMLDWVLAGTLGQLTCRGQPGHVGMGCGGGSTGLSFPVSAVRAPAFSSFPSLS